VKAMLSSKEATQWEDLKSKVSNVRDHSLTIAKAAECKHTEIHNVIYFMTPTQYAEFVDEGYSIIGQGTYVAEEDDYNNLRER